MKTPGGQTADRQTAVIGAFTVSDATDAHCPSLMTDSKCVREQTMTRGKIDK